MEATEELTMYIQNKKTYILWFIICITVMQFYLRAGVEDLQIQLPAVDRQPFMIQGICGEDEKWQ